MYSDVTITPIVCAVDRKRAWDSCLLSKYYQKILSLLLSPTHFNDCVDVRFLTLNCIDTRGPQGKHMRTYRWHYNFIEAITARCVPPTRSVGHHNARCGDLFCKLFNRTETQARPLCWQIPLTQAVIVVLLRACSEPLFTIQKTMFTWSLIVIIESMCCNAALLLNAPDSTLQKLLNRNPVTWINAWNISGSCNRNMLLVCWHCRI